MRRRLNPLLAVLLALLLVLAQQAALAHFIGHLGASGHEVAQPEEPGSHAAALSLSHVCTTCLAFAALGAAAPQTQLNTPVDAAPLIAAAAAPTPLVSLRGPPYRSRAPPVLA